MTVPIIKLIITSHLVFLVGAMVTKVKKKVMVKSVYSNNNVVMAT